jgi:hypothetical protein
MSRAIAGAVFVLMTLLSGDTFVLNAQTQPTPSSTQDPKNQDVAAIEAIVHGNPSEHVAEDVSFTNIFGTVRRNLSSAMSKLVKRLQGYLGEKLSESSALFVPT